MNNVFIVVEAVSGLELGARVEVTNRHGQPYKHLEYIWDDPFDYVWVRRVGSSDTLVKALKSNLQHIELAPVVRVTYR